MSRILGLDVGTNSLGWAVVDREDGEAALVDKGVHIFQEGVKYEKGNERSRAAERTLYRSARRLIRRRRIRKANLLEILVKNGFCPDIGAAALQDWRNKKKYPLDGAFLEWQRTSEAGGKNPYYYRYLAVTQKLNPDNEAERHILGRALYHLTQRRGFLSNRLDSRKESEGNVKTGITTLTTEIENAGCRYLGEYFYHCYLHKVKVRKRYTARNEHYLEEFRAICRKQELGKELAEQLEKAIFSQRPLKSQKGAVGKCVFEKNKRRCPVSHPSFEEFRMLCFLNNIKIQKPSDTAMRPLDEAERDSVIPLFYRTSKNTFPFEDIAKKLAPKKQYKYYKERFYPESDTIFNFPMETTVSGSPATACFVKLWGKGWKEAACTQYTDKNKKDGIKTVEDVVNDIWHVLFTFDNDDKLAGFAKNKLNLSDEDTREFVKITFKQGYASLSLKAIGKILPGLRKGMVYSHAVFLANLDKVIPSSIWQQPEKQEEICTDIRKLIEGEDGYNNIVTIVNGLVRICHAGHYSRGDNPVQAEALKKECENRIKAHYGKNRWEELPEDTRAQVFAATFKCFSEQMRKNLNRGEFIKSRRIDERIGEYLREHWGVTPEALKRLYHPSDTQTYKRPSVSGDGKRYLGSPRINALKNPMAMRSLFRLRHLVNELIAANTIDENTKIQIELSRELNDSNKRIALQRRQKQKEKERSNAGEEIRKLFKAEYGRDIEPSEDDILKYRLWQEQGGICIYTGEKIPLSGFIGTHPRYDIEHTIPQSRSYDNSQVNLTLCNSIYNREVKRNKIPYELPEHADIILRIASWEKKYGELRKQTEFWKSRGKNAVTKESKDSARQEYHLLRMERDYWQEKHKRFTMRDVPDGFKNSQLVDNGIISKYACQYLKTVFNKVHAVKGTAVAEFRKAWGLQQEYVKKARTNHAHHCEDAIVIASMSKKDYEELARLFYEDELWRQQRGGKPLPFPKPWKNFTEDVANINREILVSHYTPDVLPKQSREKVRERGKIVRDAHGLPLISQGDTVRGALHMETNYGAVKLCSVNGEGKAEEKIHYVRRIPVDSLTSADINNIVDETVRQKIMAAIRDNGSLKGGVWMNEAKQIPIKSVRCKVPSVTDPICLKKHRDLSKKEYKQYNYVANDSNYLMAIYEHTDENGKTKRSFELVNNLDAGQYFKRSNKNRTPDGIVPPAKQKGKHILKRKAILKTGTMVLFYQHSPGEIRELEPEDITRRLYKCTILKKDGRLTFKFHQEARNDENLRTDYEKSHNRKAPGSLTSGESYVNFEKPFPKLLISPSGFNMLVEGFDFRLNILGKVEPL